MPPHALRFKLSWRTQLVSMAILKSPLVANESPRLGLG